MTRKLFLTLALSCACVGIALAAAAPAIKNVNASQNKTTKCVEIYYTLEGPAGALFNVSVSAESGTQSIKVSELSGDLSNVRPGANKKIVWRIPTDWPNKKASDVVVSLSAEMVSVNEPKTYDDITAAYIEYAYEHEKMSKGKHYITETQSSSQYFIYRTDQGRYGKFKVKYCYCGYVTFDYVTYNSDGTVYKKGTNQCVSGGASFDFDSGAGDMSAHWVENPNWNDANYKKKRFWVTGTMKSMK